MTLTTKKKEKKIYPRHQGANEHPASAVLVQCSNGYSTHFSFFRTLRGREGGTQGRGPLSLAYSSQTLISKYRVFRSSLPPYPFRLPTELLQAFMGRPHPISRLTATLRCTGEEKPYFPAIQQLWLAKPAQFFFFSLGFHIVQLPEPSYGDSYPLITHTVRYCMGQVD